MKTKITTLLFITLFIIVSFISVGYSTFNANLSVSGEAAVRSIADVRITNLKIKNKTGAVQERYNNKFSKETTGIYITLPANTSITYEAEITNISTKDYIVESIQALSNNNANISVTINLQKNNIIAKNTTKTFEIILSNTTTTTQQIDIVNQYKFVEEKEPTITMSDLPSSITINNNYPINYSYTVGNSGLKEASCKSNISGTVSNLNALPAGAHTITCSVTANSGKQKSISKTTTITNTSYTITNLIKNGSYENGSTNWTLSGTSVVSTVASHGSNSLLLTNGSTSGIKMSTQTLSKSSPTINHIYYGRLMFMSNSTFTTADCRFEWYYTDSSQALLVFAKKSQKTDKWILLSDRLTITASTYLSRSWYIRNFQVSPNSNSYTDELVLVDLTEAFGAGNEPSKEWCDENIKYFDGSITIYK